MASFKLEILKSADKDIRKIDKRYIRPVFDAIRALSENPFPPQCKKLKGSESSYRLRVGSYRILYEIDFQEKMIMVSHIRHRQDGYKRS